MSDAPPQSTQSSGTTVAPIPDALLVDEMSTDLSQRPFTPSNISPGEEQALESHEVIELQTFSERKTWIEEKIKFLEQMPPIEVFVGLDAISTSAEEVPGLPTQETLQQWLVEHDTIEKETEIFDTGELTKLRQLTKAATQRNLSPADTDVIELTLTTIYELDKLLHLLRDRSEHLELLGIRLAWEEYRISAWIERRKIIEDLSTFINDRARWTPAVYETTTVPEEPKDLKRRGSIASFASATSESSITSAGFSRSARFKLAEVLSRDAAQFAGRVSSLRHGKVTAAGKALDKLIDHSRKPVPEVLLDEQDKLEEKGITEMEHIGKFIMNLVMQWRKADEIYVETMKDKITAQNLLEEIETAMLYHPSARQSASFLSRTDALIKRLALRGNPASSSSTFPCPEHVLFSDQKDFNESLVQSLSSEIKSVTDLAKKVDTIAKSYRTGYEAVKRVETLTTLAGELSGIFTNIIERLQGGVSAGDGDGSPPDLMSKACLEPSCHSAFLALLPSILEEGSQVAERANQALRSSHAAIIGLDLPGIDATFKTNAVAELQRLTSLQQQAQDISERITAQTNRLREARRIWAVMDVVLHELEETRRRLGEAMEKQRWRADIRYDERPLTPESPPTVTLPSNVTPTEVTRELDQLIIRIAHDIDTPLSHLSTTLERPLNDWLTQSSMGLKSLLETVAKMIHLLDLIQQQAVSMHSVHGEFNDLQIRVEDMQMRINSRIDQVLTGSTTADDGPRSDVALHNDIQTIRNEVEAFVNGLAKKVLFIGQRSDPSNVGTNFTKRRFSSVDLKLGAPQLYTSVELPFDFGSLDNAVRSDSNAFAMKLNGKLENLKHSSNYLRIAVIAKEVDYLVSGTVADINSFAQELSDFRDSFVGIMSTCDMLDPLNILLRDVEEAMLVHQVALARSFSPIRGLLQTMDSSPGAQDVSIREALYITRYRSVDDAKLRYDTWENNMAVFKEEIIYAQKIETKRLEQLRITEEKYLQAEKERIAAEEVERLRAEKEQFENEEKRRLEDARQAERLQLEIERVKIIQEEAEKVRLERDLFVAEQRQKVEDERAAEDCRLQEERRRVAAEEARLHQERLELEEKLRLMEEQLAHERHLQAQKEYAATEKIRQLKVEDQLQQSGAHTAGQHHIDNEQNQIVAEEIPKEVLKGHVNVDDEDVFSLRVVPSMGHSKTQEIIDLQAKILGLRKRLRSISIKEMSHPSKSSILLPNQEQLDKMTREFSSVSSEVTNLPTSVKDPSVDTELRSLRTEVKASAELLERVTKLAHLSDAIRTCDSALSDLLEHIDSYPASPQGVLSSSYKPLLGAPPEQQLAARLSFTRDTVENMSLRFADVAEDTRAISERTRILQTWSELEEMSNDRLGGKKSRPGSVVSSRPSSGRSSSAAIASSRTTKKMGSYANLSVSSSQKRLLAPAQPTPRRAVSGSAEPQSRPVNQPSSMSSNRAVSGPLGLSVYGSTFASRQRTISLSNTMSTPTRHVSGISAQSRARAGQIKRGGSPTISEASSHSHSVRAHSRSSTSMSTWSRAPRDSLSTIMPRASTPQKKPPVPRKKYIADPKNKLDMAVGDVVNKLPVGINIEGVSETWKDQSGKYWIGNQDPKLCFCRILRSQTVMVRVGGGWSELSKFIQDHFADSFRLIPESPPRPGAPEEKWISSRTLLEAPELDSETPPEPPRTPEPSAPFVPSFSLLTPSRQSPYSIKSNSPSAKGSPLTPLQFIRRADVDAMLRPVTPSKSPSLRPRNNITHTSTRNSVWRP